jgi:hypothetical protein
MGLPKLFQHLEHPFVVDQTRRFWIQGPCVILPECCELRFHGSMPCIIELYRMVPLEGIRGLLMFFLSLITMVEAGRVAVRAAGVTGCTNWRR